MESPMRCNQSRALLPVVNLHLKSYTRHLQCKALHPHMTSLARKIHLWLHLNVWNTKTMPPETETVCNSMIRVCLLLGNDLWHICFIYSNLHPWAMSLTYASGSSKLKPDTQEACVYSMSTHGLRVTFSYTLMSLSSCYDAFNGWC